MYAGYLLRKLLVALAFLFLNWHFYSAHLT